MAYGARHLRTGAAATAGAGRGTPRELARHRGFYAVDTEAAAMRWPFGRHRNHDEADAAIKRAKDDLEQVKGQAHEVSRVASFLRERRESNHFGEGLMAILRGDR
jgi:hypothetical protein